MALRIILKYVSDSHSYAKRLDEAIHRVLTAKQISFIIMLFDEQALSPIRYRESILPAVNAIAYTQISRVVY